MNQMTIDNFEENQGVEEQIPANNTQPNISPIVKRYRAIATILTALYIIVSFAIEYTTNYVRNYSVYAILDTVQILLCLLLPFSLFKLSANKATQNAVIIFFFIIIFQNHFTTHFLCFGFFHNWTLNYAFILYYITISYAISIILRNNNFKEDKVKETWIALFPLLWICQHTLLLIFLLLILFSAVLIPSCFYIIYSSAFSGPSKEEVTISKPYAAVNRYTIASVIVCILTYAMQITYNIITTHI